MGKKWTEEQKARARATRLRNLKLKGKKPPLKPSSASKGDAGGTPRMVTILVRQCKGIVRERAFTGKDLDELELRVLLLAKEVLGD